MSPSNFACHGQVVICSFNDLVDRWLCLIPCPLCNWEWNVTCPEGKFTCLRWPDGHTSFETWIRLPLLLCGILYDSLLAVYDISFRPFSHPQMLCIKSVINDQNHHLSICQLTELPKDIISAPSCNHFGRHGEWKKYFAPKILKSPIGDPQVKRETYQ